MVFTTTDILLLALVIQCLAFAFTLLNTKRGNKNSNTHLAMLLLIFSTQMSLNLLEGHGIYLIWVSRPLSIAYGPVVLLYTRSVILSGFNKNRSSILHFIPVLAGMLLYYFMKGQVLNIGLLILVHFISYGAYSTWLIIKFYKAQNRLKPNPTAVAWQWIAELFLGTLIVMLMTWRFDVLHTELLFNTLIISLFLIINLIGFRGVLKPNQFLGFPEVEILAAQDVENKYLNTSLSNQELIQIAKSIEDFIQDKHPYLDQSLNLSSFAQAIALSPRTVSQVVNQQLKQNFSDYINQHRLEHAKALLISTTNAEKNISEVIDESGFNSKTRFYTLFKGSTGLSPKAFRERNSG